jgi:hypothetical protein
MKIVTQLRFYVVLVTIAFIGLLVNYFKVKNELDECKNFNPLQGGDIEKARIIDSLESRCDSLYWELFPAQVELGRYQVAYEIFMERNPIAAKQYGTIISEETE